MVNKLWYQDDFLENRSIEEEVTASRRYIQRYIDLYCPERFNVPEDITPDNFQDFLEIILKYYGLYLFNLNELLNLAESIDLYFHRAYWEDFPDTLFPKYPETDRRELALYILVNIDQWIGILPEDAPTLIKCLNVPEEQIIDMYDYIDNYFYQFDLIKRANESRSRQNFVNDQRKEAIAKGEPIPIRPMGIEIDLYYKKTT